MVHKRDHSKLLPPGANGNGMLSGESAHIPLPPAVEYVTDYSAETTAGTLLEYWQMTRRRKWTLVASAAVFTLAGFLFGLPQKPVFQARGSLEVEPLNENFLNTRELSPTEALPANSLDSYVQTQVDLLQDEPMIERVVDRLKLAARPEFNQPAQGFGKLLQSLRLARPDPSTPRARAVRFAAANLRVRSSSQTRIITLSYDSTDPRLAADFVNTLAAEFIQRNLEARWDSGRQTSQWLERQAEELRAKLEKSEHELQSYAATNGLLLTDEKDSVADIKLRQIQDELSRAQADRIAKESQYDQAHAKNNRPDSLPQMQDSRALQDYETKLTDLRRELADLSALLTPNNYKVQRVQAQINALEAAVARERSNLMNRINNEYSTAYDRELKLARAYARQAGVVSHEASRMIHYNTLKREVDTLRQLHASMVQRAQEARIASTVHASNIRVAATAVPPARPYKPNLLLNAGVGLFAGLLFGLALMVIREHSDRSVRGPGDSASYLNVPELGVIPSARVENRGVLAPLMRSDAVDLAPWKRKNSILAESFRETLLSLLYNGRSGSASRVIVFTSPGPAEGKTTIVSNLGMALAEIGQRVLLISGDLRQPRLHHVFGVENNYGLSDLLAGEFPVHSYNLKELAKSTSIPNLWVLPSGPVTTQCSRLLTGNLVIELLRRCRAEFDLVLVDAPPALGFADARLLARAADGVILILRANQTSRDAATTVAQRFAMDGVPLLGTILNDWDPKSNHAYGYGSYGKYYGRYFNASAE